jgi:hypothetical protein
MSVRSEETPVRAPADGGAVFSRVVLKLSGEALMGTREYGIDVPVVRRLAAEIAAVHASGVGIAIVVGGGNFYRGMSAAAEGMERTRSRSRTYWSGKARTRVSSRRSR